MQKRTIVSLVMFHNLSQLIIFRIATSLLRFPQIYQDDPSLQAARSWTPLEVDQQKERLTDQPSEKP